MAMASCRHIGSVRQLDQLLSAEDRQIGAPRLAAEPILCHVSMSRNRLTLVINLEEPASLRRTAELGSVAPGGMSLLILDQRPRVSGRH